MLTLSSKISKTHEVVASVAPLFKDKLKIWLFDLPLSSAWRSRLALEADRALQRGQSIPGIVSRLHCCTVGSAYLFITIGKLVLIKAGRLSAPATSIGGTNTPHPAYRRWGSRASTIGVRTLERALDTMISAALLISQATGLAKCTPSSLAWRA